MEIEEIVSLKDLIFDKETAEVFICSICPTYFFDVHYFIYHQAVNHPDQGQNIHKMLLKDLPHGYKLEG